MHWILALSLLVAGFPMLQEHRTPGSGPVDIEFNDPPETMKTGDVTTTTVVFRSGSDLDQLEVFLVPDDGLEVLSGSQHAIFTNVKRGDAPQVEMRVRLTAETGASLNVSYVSRMKNVRGGGGIAIDYGNP